MCFDVKKATSGQYKKPILKYCIIIEIKTILNCIIKKKYLNILKKSR